MADQTALEVVRNAEGWTARLLNPLDGSAHPRVDLTQTPAALAFNVGRQAQVVPRRCGDGRRYGVAARRDA